MLSFCIAAALVVVLPGTYWWTVVRGGRARPRSMLLAIVCSVLGARIILPPAHRSFVTGARLLTFALELGITLWAIWQVQQALRRARGRTREGSDDVVELLQHSLESSFGRRIWVRAVAMEIATFYYVFGGRGDRPGDDTSVFAVDTSSQGAISAGLLMVITIETVVMHLLLLRWSLIAAIALTALSAYSMLWLVGDLRAASRRPVLLERGRVLLRVGLRCHAVVGLEQIRAVSVPTWRSVPEHAARYLNVARPSRPNVVLEFREPVTMTTLLGIQRRAAAIGLRLKDPEGFCVAVLSAIARFDTSAPRTPVGDASESVEGLAPRAP